MTTVTPLGEAASFAWSFTNHRIAIEVIKELRTIVLRNDGSAFLRMNDGSEVHVMSGDLIEYTPAAVRITRRDHVTTASAPVTQGPQSELIS